MSERAKKERVFIVPTISGSLLGISSFALFFYAFLYGFGLMYVLSIFLITLFLAIGFLSNNNIKALNIEGEDKIVIEENSSEEIFYKISNLDKESNSPYIFNTTKKIKAVL